MPRNGNQAGSTFIRPFLPKVIAFLVEVATGERLELDKLGNAVPSDKAPDLVAMLAYDVKDRIAAAKELLAYGMSKPATKVAGPSLDPEDPEADGPVTITVNFKPWASAGQVVHDSKEGK